VPYIANYIRQIQLVDRQNLGGDDPEDPAKTTMLIEKIAAEAAHTLKLVGHVKIPLLYDLGLLGGTQDFKQNFLGCLWGQGRMICHRHHFTMETKNRRETYHNMQIAGALFLHCSEK
jgi:hypothetical protein